MADEKIDPSVAQSFRDRKLAEDKSRASVPDAKSAENIEVRGSVADAGQEMQVVEVATHELQQWIKRFRQAIDRAECHNLKKFMKHIPDNIEEEHLPDDSSESDNDGSSVVDQSTLDTVKKKVRKKFEYALSRHKKKKRINKEIQKHPNCPLVRFCELCKQCLKGVPSPRRGKFVICPGSDDPFSSTIIDTTLTGFDKPEQIKALQAIYREFTYIQAKSDYADAMLSAGGEKGDLPRFAVRKINFRPCKNPKEKKETTVAGMCQLGKSIEAAWTAWCSYFVLGCVPVIFTRNGSGPQGEQDMQKTVEGLNRRIDTYLKGYMSEKGIAERLLGSVENFKLTVRKTKDQLITKCDRGNKKFYLPEPQVLMRQNNVTQLKKFTEKFRHPVKYEAKILKVIIGPAKKRKRSFEKYLVELTESKDTIEIRGDCMIAASKDRTEHSHVKVKFRTQDRPSIIDNINAMYGLKDELARLVFVIDEADMIVKSANRKGSAVQRKHYETRGVTLQQKKNALEIVKLLKNADKNHRTFHHRVKETDFQNDKTAYQEYLTLIGGEEKMLSLECVKKKVDNDEYKHIQGFLKDMNRMFENAEIFNEQYSEAFPGAEELRQMFKVFFDEKFPDVTDRELVKAYTGIQYQIYHVVNITATPLAIFYTSFYINKRKKNWEPLLVPQVVFVDVPGNYLAYDRENLHGKQIWRNYTPKSKAPGSLYLLWKNTLKEMKLITDEELEYLQEQLMQGGRKSLDIGNELQKRQPDPTRPHPLYKFRLLIKPPNEFKISQPSGSWRKKLRGPIGNTVRKAVALKDDKVKKDKERKAEIVWTADKENIISMVTHMTNEVCPKIESTEPTNSSDACSQIESKESLSHYSSQSSICHEKWRHGLIITSRTGSSIEKQKLMARKILENFNNRLIVTATFSYKGVEVYFSKAAEKANLHEKMMSRLENICREKKISIGTKHPKFTPDPNFKFEKRGDFYVKIRLKPSLKQPMTFLYEALREPVQDAESMPKSIVPAIVVITGRIGGRGISYRDFGYFRLLTDMYVSFPVSNEGAIKVNGETVIQQVGRLNLLETFTRNKRSLPIVRLWANQACHDLHQLYLKQIDGLVRSLNRTGDYFKSFEKHKLFMNKMGYPIRDVHKKINDPIIADGLISSKRINVQSSVTPFSSANDSMETKDLIVEGKRRDFIYCKREEKEYWQINGMNFGTNIFSLSAMNRHVEKTLNVWESKASNTDNLMDLGPADKNLLSQLREAADNFKENKPKQLIVEAASLTLTRFSQEDQQKIGDLLDNYMSSQDGYNYEADGLQYIENDDDDDEFEEDLGLEDDGRLKSIEPTDRDYYDEHLVGVVGEKICVILAEDRPSRSRQRFASESKSRSPARRGRKRRRGQEISQEDNEAQPSRPSRRPRLASLTSPQTGSGTERLSESPLNGRNIGKMEAMRE